MMTRCQWQADAAGAVGALPDGTSEPTVLEAGATPTPSLLGQPSRLIDRDDRSVSAVVPTSLNVRPTSRQRPSRSYRPDPDGRVVRPKSRERTPSAIRPVGGR